MNCLNKLKKYYLGGRDFLFYLFIFLLPWQTKLIIRPADTNFTEISLYARELILLLWLLLVSISGACRSPKINWEQFKRNWAIKNKLTIFWCLMLIWWLLVALSIFSASDQLLSFSRLLLFSIGLGLVYFLKNKLDFSGQPCLEDFSVIDYQAKTDSVTELKGGLSKLKIIYVFLGSLILQVVLGIYQFLTQSTPVCKYLGLAVHDPGVLGTAVVETLSGRWLRTYGGFDHPNIFGGVLVLGLILAAYLFSHQLEKLKNSGNKPIFSLGHWRSVKSVLGTDIFLLIFYFLSLAALFFTFSRGAWLALSVGLIILLVYFLKQPIKSVRYRYLALLFFSVIFLLVTALPYQELIITRLRAEARLEQKSLAERQLYLNQAQKIIREHIFTGVGSGNYTLALKNQDLAWGQPSQPIWNYQPVHNFFLLLWAECGIFAFLVFSTIFAYLLIKNRRSGLKMAILVALIILLFVDHWFWSLPFGTLMLLFILGLI